MTSIEKKEYSETSDYHKIVQIVNQYQSKYEVDLNTICPKIASVEQLRDSLTKEIMFLYSKIADQSANDVKEEVIVLDYLITLRQLLFILAEDNIQTFHTKSKM